MGVAGGQVSRPASVVSARHPQCIKGWNGLVDVCEYFPLKVWLCIQVDGKTHYGDTCMSDRQEDTQQAADASFNTVALGKGRSVLRLDSRHSLRAWMAALGQAVVACMSGAPPQVFVSQN